MESLGAERRGGRAVFAFDKPAGAWQVPATAARPFSPRGRKHNKESFVVAKPEWGIKRTCQSCAAVFYDLKRSPIVCPKCGAQYDPEAVLKSRRSRAQPAEEAKPTAAAIAAAAATAAAAAAAAAKAEAVEPEPVEEAAAKKEGEEEVVPEDASDLGEDDDDLGEVMENVEDEKE